MNLVLFMFLLRLWLKLHLRFSWHLEIIVIMNTLYLKLRPVQVCSELWTVLLWEIGKATLTLTEIVLVPVARVALLPAWFRSIHGHGQANGINLRNGSLSHAHAAVKSVCQPRVFWKAARTFTSPTPSNDVNDVYMPHVLARQVGWWRHCCSWEI